MCGVWISFLKFKQISECWITFLSYSFTLLSITVLIHIFLSFNVNKLTKSNKNKQLVKDEPESSKEEEEKEEDGEEEKKEEEKDGKADGKSKKGGGKRKKKEGLLDIDIDKEEEDEDEDEEEEEDDKGIKKKKKDGGMSLNEKMKKQMLMSSDEEGDDDDEDEQEEPMGGWSRLYGVHYTVVSSILCLYFLVKKELLRYTAWLLASFKSQVHVHSLIIILMYMEVLP